MRTRQQHQAKLDAEEGGEYQPTCALEMHMPPILGYDVAGDRDGNEDRQRCRHLQRNSQDEQRDGQQGFTKSKG
jgi:hypothetical protein